MFYNLADILTNELTRVDVRSRSNSAATSFSVKNLELVDGFVVAHSAVVALNVGELECGKKSLNPYLIVPLTRRLSTLFKDSAMRAIASNASIGERT